MKSRIYQLKQIQLLIVVVISLTVVFMLVSGLSGYDDQYASAEVDRVRETVDKYIIQCYATEGAYPPNIDYLAKHYGLILDEEKYIYEYEPVAENIKPVVQIFIRLDYQ